MFVKKRIYVSLCLFYIYYFIFSVYLIKIRSCSYSACMPISSFHTCFVVGNSLIFFLGRRMKNKKKLFYPLNEIAFVRVLVHNYYYQGRRNNNRQLMSSYVWDGCSSCWNSVFCKDFTSTFDSIVRRMKF